MSLAPVRATEEELKRIIGRLNDNFRLNLRHPDPSLSPSKRKRQPRTEDDRRVDLIYHRIRALHFKRDPRLAECLGYFQTRADQLLRDAQSHEENYSPLADGVKRALHGCLLEALPDPLSDQSVLPRTRRGKRPSDELPVLGSKRTKSRTDSDGAMQQSPAVDALPVRSIQRPLGEDTSEKNSFNLTHDFSGSRTTVSSRPSMVSQVFSFTNAEPNVSNTQTTIESDIEQCTQDLYPVCTQEQQALEESFSKLEADGTVETRWDLGGQAITANDGTEYSSIPGLEDLDTSSEMFHTARPGKNLTLEDRLRGVWPKLPGIGLNDAPLAVLWEVTRAALHCGVDLHSCDLTYKPNDSWHDVNKMRGQLLSNRAFVGKGLPPSSDTLAWSVALDKFQSGTKAITLSAELVYRPGDDNGPLFDLRLDPLKFELSHRLARRFGPDRFLEVTMPSPTSRHQPGAVKYAENGPEKIIQWLTQKCHYFLGRTWVPFYTRKTEKKVKDLKSKDKEKVVKVYPERVFFFAVDGDQFRPDSVSGIPAPEEALALTKRTKLRVSALLNWAVDLPENMSQPVPKLFSRLSLSLTRTWPSLVLEPHQLRHCSEDLKTHKVMNDGVARMSRSFARKVADSLGLSDTPSAFQARIGSAKGVWIIDVNDSGLEDWIETYPSQRKWLCDFEEPHHRTFEVKDWPRELKSAALNQQFIPVLESQCHDPKGMRKAIAGHLVAGLRAELNELKAAMSHPTELRLWMAQSAPSKDLSRRFEGYVPFVGGLPDKDEDMIAFLLDSGFNPGELQILMDKVWKMGRRKAELLLTKMNIKIPCSTQAFMVADFEGVLEEGEVHLSFSTKFQADEVSTESFSSEPFSDTNLEGFDILVARSPAHFPRDIQKVRVVSKPQLRRLKDVVIFSTKGRSPLADLLSGGDYDGDKAWVCWDQTIVGNFRNASNIHTCPDLFEAGYLRQHNPKFQDLLNKNSLLTGHTDEIWDRTCTEFLHDGFSFNMKQALLGQCTNYKERFCYWNQTIDNEAAFRLSTLLSDLVDQAKQGTVFTYQDWERFRIDLVPGKKDLGDPEFMKERSSVMSRAGPHHVLDYLKFEVAKSVIDTSLTDLDQAVNKVKGPSWDHDLTRAFKECNRQANESDSTSFRDIISNLGKDIREVEDFWKRKQAVSMNQEDGPDFPSVVREVYQRWVDIKPRAEDGASKRVPRHVDRLFESWSFDRHITAWELLKASATFSICYSRNKAFVWYVAGRQLGVLKARARVSSANNSSVLVVPEMMAVLRPDKRLIKSMAASRSVGKDGDSAAALEEVMEFSDDDGFTIDY